MEVKLDKRYDIGAGPEAAWRVLSDVRAVAACMPGAQITDQADATHYKGTVRSKVGPAVMSFNGDIEVLALEPATRSMTMLGKGADKAGSSASMNLAARIEPDAAGGSVLAGTATIVVSGKLAQFGSRLLVPVSDAMLKQFADNFRAAVAALPAPDAPAADVAADAAPAQVPGAPGARAADATTADATAAAATALPAGDAAAAAAAPATAAAPSDPAAAAAATALPDRASNTASPVPRPAPVRALPPAAPVKELNVLGLAWSVARSWFAGLFSRKG